MNEKPGGDRAGYPEPGAQAGGMRRGAAGGAPPRGPALLPAEPEFATGARPAHAGDLTVEGQGISVIPEDERYGGLHRIFTVWCAPNMELSAVFTGTLAAVLRLSDSLAFTTA